MRFGPASWHRPVSMPRWSLWALWVLVFALGYWVRGWAPPPTPSQVVVAAVLIPIVIAAVVVVTAIGAIPQLALYWILGIIAGAWGWGRTRLRGRRAPDWRR